MPRKNSRAKKPRLKRNRHAEAMPKALAAKKLPPIPLSEFVRPSGVCPTKKLRYGTQDDAKRALKDAQRDAARKGHLHAEKRFYLCPRCDGFHLTSREQFIQRPLDNHARSANA